MNNRPSRSLGFVGLPHSRLGWWSIGLATAFIALLSIWLSYALYLRPITRPTFLSDPLHAVLLVSAAAAAITGAILGVLALVSKRERSFLILLSILLGTIVLYWTISNVINPSP